MRKLVGGTVGGAACLVLLAVGFGTALYSRMTYYRRAKKRLVQDQIYNLVIGIRSQDPFSDDMGGNTNPIKPKVLLPLALLQKHLHLL